MASTTYRLFLSTPSARRATQHLCRCPAAVHHFYPRPPRGGRPRICEVGNIKKRFLSTPSARRATSASTAARCLPEFLSTPSARRATGSEGVDISSTGISIHALREEGDRAAAICSSSSYLFLSTPSARRATRPRHHDQPPARISIHALREEGDRDPRRCHAGEGAISIHALREEGDRATVCGRRPTCYFYPRPPRGGRHVRRRSASTIALFLSTPSARRATVFAVRRHLRPLRFLSTPSARRATGDPAAVEEVTPYFYPRPPRGGRPWPL